MAYIAKTNGGQTVLELREGVLSDIDEADRANWRSVSEVQQTVDGIATQRGPMQITVNGDGSQVNLIHTSVAHDPAWRRLALKKRAAHRRWQVETGGIVVNGLAVPTDDRAKLLIQGAAQTVGDAETKTFVIGTSKLSMTGLEFQALWAAIVGHVQACFDAQGSLLDAIDADTVTLEAEIDAWPWP